jgi:hypothetical protein
MAKLSPRAVRIKDAMAAVYGDRGLTKMAEASGISKQLLSFIIAGDREVTDDTYEKIADGLLDEAYRLRKAAAVAELQAGKIYAELEK